MNFEHFNKLDHSITFDLANMGKSRRACMAMIIWSFSSLSFRPHHCKSTFLFLGFILISKDKYVFSHGQK